jgi:hypothetical protein
MLKLESKDSLLARVWHGIEPFLRSTSLGQGAVLDHWVFSCPEIIFLFSNFRSNSVIEFETKIIISLTFRAFHMFKFLYVMYYASLLQWWHPVMILVRTNRPYLRVGCHTGRPVSFVHWSKDRMVLSSQTISRPSWINLLSPPKAEKWSSLKIQSANQAVNKSLVRSYMYFKIDGN